MEAQCRLQTVLTMNRITDFKGALEIIKRKAPLVLQEIVNAQEIERIGATLVHFIRLQIQLLAQIPRLVQLEIRQSGRLKHRINLLLQEPLAGVIHSLDEIIVCLLMILKQVVRLTKIIVGPRIVGVFLELFVQEFQVELLASHGSLFHVIEPAIHNVGALKWRDNIHVSLVLNDLVNPVQIL